MPPKRYVQDAEQRGIYTPHTQDEIEAAIKAHCAAIEPEEVCCYCFSCYMGLEAGGKDAVNILELVSGHFRN